ncbi:MAG: tetratricopeptide repeat protein [Alistipes sp.]|nr:tetratricopeptide repeat protein [Alistipes sp.]
MARITINPTSSGLWHVDGLGDELRRSREREKESWAAAADMRFEAVQRLVDVLGEEEVHLDWEHRPTRAAMELLYAAAADQFVVGETETAAALWEMLLEVDEEDHMSVSVLLAFCYVELEDYDCWDEMMFSISPKTPEYHLLTLWAEYRRTGGVDRDALRALRSRHKVWAEEFFAEEHPIDEAYIKDSHAERPSPQTEARELYFATAPLWERNANFMKTIKKA